MSFDLETAANPTGLRRVAIDPVSRVEGHGKVTILLDDQQRVQQVRLHIVEFRGFEKFCTGPGKTSLKPGEIVVSLTLPKRPKNSSDAYLRLIPRTEMDIAVVGVGISLTMKGDTVTDARVGLGAVAPTVLLVDKAAEALIGSKLDDAALDAAAAACSAACKPIDDKRGTIKYRTKIAGVLLKRTAMIARDRINGVEHRGHRPV